MLVLLWHDEPKGTSITTDNDGHIKQSQFHSVGLVCGTQQQCMAGLVETSVTLMMRLWNRERAGLVGLGLGILFCGWIGLERGRVGGELAAPV